MQAHLWENLSKLEHGLAKMSDYHYSSYNTAIITTDIQASCPAKRQLMKGGSDRNTLHIKQLDWTVCGTRGDMYSSQATLLCAAAEPSQHWPALVVEGVGM